ncbi:MAG TPA: phosphopyruvate hydratase [Casimicrobiaceae bacterium]|nr:phosphopyruvate hydratase [Casimicrobiaceae bacterium]
MTPLAIRSLHAREILDSRGRPTVEVDAVLVDGSFGRASVPSGASTGAAEAHELRDGDAGRYAGLGVLGAVRNVNVEILAALRGTDAVHQRIVDGRLRELDGTENLSRLGANATLAVSLAVCRAVAACRGQALYERIAELAATNPVLPLPMTNILSGGLHAGRGMDVQDFLAMPMRAQSVAEAISTIARVRSAADEVLRARGLPTLLADEGGLAPGCRTGRAALELLIEAIERAGLRPGEDIAIAVDVAATTMKLREGRYRLQHEARELSSAELVDLLDEWVRDFPLVSIEDGLDEEDWGGWKILTARMGSRVQIVGDDLFATNAHRLERGVREGVANAVLVKANQNGTLTGTLDVIAQAKVAGYRTIVSARSGETEDPFIADLAVGSSAAQIKIGSLRMSNTVAKYNELMRIEERSGARYAGFDALRTPNR